MVESRWQAEGAAIQHLYQTNQQVIIIKCQAIMTNIYSCLVPAMTQWFSDAKPGHSKDLEVKHLYLQQPEAV